MLGRHLLLLPILFIYFFLFPIGAGDEDGAARSSNKRAAPAPVNDDERARAVEDDDNGVSTGRGWGQWHGVTEKISFGVQMGETQIEQIPRGGKEGLEVLFSGCFSN
ncbi:unnamed protein product [Citrullus colocynthis]|uniref:Uncharacterized protein n=1 Tax=Citrullus colocynthis TaxID=252529 RepID=A0ABP0Z575_9ROSI